MRYFLSLWMIIFVVSSESFAVQIFASNTGLVPHAKNAIVGVLAAGESSLPTNGNTFTVEIDDQASLIRELKKIFKNLGSGITIKLPEFWQLDGEQILQSLAKKTLVLQYDKNKEEVIAFPPTKSKSLIEKAEEWMSENSYDLQSAVFEQAKLEKAENLEKQTKRDLKIREELIGKWKFNRDFIKPVADLIGRTEYFVLKSNGELRNWQSQTAGTWKVFSDGSVDLELTGGEEYRYIGRGTSDGKFLEGKIYSNHAMEREIGTFKAHLLADDYWSEFFVRGFVTTKIAQNMSRTRTDLTTIRLETGNKFTTNWKKAQNSGNWEFRGNALVLTFLNQTKYVFKMDYSGKEIVLREESDPDLSIEVSIEN